MNLSRIVILICPAPRGAILAIRMRSCWGSTLRSSHFSISQATSPPAQPTPENHCTPYHARCYPLMLADQQARARIRKSLRSLCPTFRCITTLFAAYPGICLYLHHDHGNLASLQERVTPLSVPWLPPVSLGSLIDELQITSPFVNICSFDSASADFEYRWKPFWLLMVTSLVRELL